jgi:hypothetical protein
VTAKAEAVAAKKKPAKSPSRSPLKMEIKQQDEIAKLEQQRMVAVDKSRNANMAIKGLQNQAEMIYKLLEKFIDGDEKTQLISELRDTKKQLTKLNKVILARAIAPPSVAQSFCTPYQVSSSDVAPPSSLPCEIAGSSLEVEVTSVMVDSALEQGTSWLDAHDSPLVDPMQNQKRKAKMPDPIQNPKKTQKNAPKEPTRKSPARAAKTVVGYTAV